MGIDVRLPWRNSFFIRAHGLPMDRATLAKDELIIKNYKPSEETNYHVGEPTDATRRRITSIRIRDNRRMYKNQS